MADYKTQLHEAITQLQAETKRGELPRSLRFIKIESLIDDYFVRTSEMPDGIMLERLSDLCLQEEISDTNVHKVAHTEYPFLSETQLARRREGRHIKKDAKRKEVSFEAASTFGVDGRDHRRPTRNVFDDFSDDQTKITNKKRKKLYSEFISGKLPGLFTVNISTGEKTHER